MDGPITIDEALTVRRKVCLIGVIIEKSIGKRSNGTDFHCSMRIIDSSNRTDGLLINFFTGTMEDLPQIQAIGDIISLFNVQMQNYRDDKINAVFNKSFSAYAIYEGKYAQSVQPYNWSLYYHTRNDNRQAVDAVRNWFNSVLFDLVSNISSLRYLREGNPTNLICEILHAQVNQDGAMLFIWDANDVTSHIIHEPLGNEKDYQLPLQIENERLSIEVLSNFPTVGTILRVKVDRTKWQQYASFLTAGSWIYFIQLKVAVTFGLWYGSFESCTVVRRVPDQDSYVMGCLRKFEERRNAQWDRLPSSSYVLTSITETKTHPDTAPVTLMDIINHPEEGNFKCMVRVVTMLPYDPKDYFTLNEIFRIRLTLEDPTARIHAYLSREDAEYFFDGRYDIDELTAMRNKLLGISSSEVDPRNPDWTCFCIRSYYLDDGPWTRYYKVFNTKMIG